MATPFPFVAGAVLEAAELNAITELPINNQTASYVLVAGDAGKRVVMNVASANTVTVNNSLFSAGQIVQISNIGAGITTVTAGAGVTINSADVLTLAQYQGGSLVFSSASAAVWFPTAKTIADSGLTLISSTTIGSAVSSIAITGVFSATYDNYRVLVSINSGSTTGGLSMQLGATTTGYYRFGVFGDFANTTVNGTNTDNGASYPAGASYSTDGGYGITDVVNPFASNQTGFASFTNRYATGANGITLFSGGYLNNTTSYTDVTFLTSAGTVTGGTIKIYGYKN